MAAVLATIMVRGDTAANWTAANPVLALCELGVETDTKKFKLGDGATAWNALAYALNVGSIVGITGTKAQYNTSLSDGDFVFAGDIDAASISDATTVGRNLLKLANPGAVTFLRLNADNTATARAASDFRGDLSLGTAALKNTGTSGNTVPLLDGANTHSGAQIFSAGAAAAGLRSTGENIVGDGPGVDLQFDGTNGNIVSYHRPGSGYLPLRLLGTNVLLIPQGGSSTVGGPTSFPDIGTTASAANAFLDSGANNNLLRSTSSRRYKTDITSLTAQEADAVLALRPVRYRSKAQADNPDWTWYGLIAEEVAEVDPRLVHWGYWPEDYDQRFKDPKPLKVGAKLRPDGVQYERISVLTLDAVRRHRDMIDELLARVSALEAANPQLGAKKG